MRVLALLTVLGALTWFPVGNFANPLGEVVIHGAVDFARNGNTLDVMQGTNRAIIEWQSFSIANGESTVFHQPGASAIALNRVVGGSQSFIDGLLQANGHVWVLNQSGVFLGKNSRVDVNGLLLSTLDVSNDDFIRGGDMNFSGNSAASVVNFGTINAAHGNVFVFAQNVENHGQIGAVDGHVVMMGSNEVLLREGGNSGNISVKGTMGYGNVYNDGTVEASSINMQAVNNNAMAMGVNQRGTLRITGAQKENGRVLLVAKGGSGVLQGGTVNTGGAAVRMESDGLIQIGGTTDASRTDGVGGSIQVIGREIQVTPLGALRSNGTTGGEVKVDATETLEIGGTVETQGLTGQGGTASLTGDQVIMRTGSVVNANGVTGGGSVFVGGGFQGADLTLRNATNTMVETGAVIQASSTVSGNGGAVAVWANGHTNFQGSILAEGIGNGGVVEVSGKNVLGFGGDVSTLGRTGQNGLLLLDPVNVTISHNGTTSGSISDSALASAWMNGNVVVHTFGGAATDAGNVNIEENVQILNTNSLNTNSFSIFAHGDINVGTEQPGTASSVAIRDYGSGRINLVAGWMPPGNGIINPFLPLPQVTGIGSQYAQTGLGGLTISASDILSGGYGAYGYNGVGGIRLNPTENAQSAVRIGSRNGETNLFGGSLAAYTGDGSSEMVHVGWYLDDTNFIPSDRVTPNTSPVTGNINVNLTLTEGTSLIAAGGVQNYQYVQFGHGGHGDLIDAPNGSILQGNVNIVSPGFTIFQGGRGSNTYAIVGHGGRLLRAAEGDAVSLMEGDITVEAGQLILAGGTGSSQNFVLIGHGGQQIGGINNNTSPLITRSHIQVTAVDGIVMGAGRDDAFVQIGSGGWQVYGNHMGTIRVTASNGDLEMIAANPTAQFVDQSHVMIGFGGFDSDGSHGIDPLHSDPALYYNPDSNPPIENRWYGGLGYDGSIAVTAGGEITMFGGSGSESFAMIGNGGRSSANETTTVTYTGSSGTTTLSGVAQTFGSTTATSGTAGATTILVSSLAPTVVPGQDVPVSILHVGSSITGPGIQPGTVVTGFNTGANAVDISKPLTADLVVGQTLNFDTLSGGNITVTAGGNITLQANDGTATGTARQQVQIGHGGYDSDGSRFGDITVTAGGTIKLDSAGANDLLNNGTESYTMIGHGGYDSSGNQSGNITVSALGGDVTLQGGYENNRFSMIGHGGRYDGSYRGTFITGQATPAVATFSNSDGGLKSGDITVLAGMPDVMNLGWDTDQDGNISQAEFDAGSAQIRTPKSFATLDSNHDGFISAAEAAAGVTSGSVSITGGLANQDLDYAGIGDVTFAMIGHSLFSAKQSSVAPFFDSGAWGNVTVNAATAVALQGGNRDWSYAAIGHGVQNTSNDFIIGSTLGSADVTVRALTGDITVRGGGYSGFDTTTSENYRYAAIGHHGANAAFDSNGNVLVESVAGNVLVEGGTQRSSGARIGSGGDNMIQGSNRQHRIVGDVEVRAMAGTVNVVGGIGYTPALGSSNVSSLPELSFGMIGNGGARMGQTNNRSYYLAGSITVDAQDVRVQGGDGSGNFAAIGHGSYQRDTGAFGSLYLAGNVTVNAVNDVNINGGDALSNSIFGGDIDLLPYMRNTGNFGQIGHFGIPLGNSGSTGSTARVNAPGDILVTVKAGRDIGLNRTSFDAGSSWGTGAYAMIGVGGNGYVSMDSNFNVPTMDITANIDVAAGRDIYLYGATSGSTFVADAGATRTIVPGQGAFAQIGNGGALVNGGVLGINGDIDVRSGNNLLIQSGVTGNPQITTPITSWDNYAKIGNGDFAFQSGARSTEGFRGGRIKVGSGGNLSIYGAMIGHVDPRFSNAIGLTGSTFVGVGRFDTQQDAVNAWLAQRDAYSVHLAEYVALNNSNADPTEKAASYARLMAEYQSLESSRANLVKGGGVLLATTNSEGVASSLEANLSGTETVVGQLRIYTPTRAQNQIAETTFLNSVSAPYLPYDHPDTGSGDVGVPLLRTSDELYDVPLFATFETEFQVGGTPYQFANKLPKTDFDVSSTALSSYQSLANHTIYYSQSPVAAPPPPISTGAPQIVRSDLPPDDQFDLPLPSRGSPGLSSALRLAGISSTYPNGSVEQDLTSFSVGQMAYRPFEVFSYKTLMDWQGGTLKFVPGVGLVLPQKSGADGSAVPVPPIGGVSPGASAFDVSFGKGVPQDDEVRQKQEDAAKGATQPEVMPPDGGAAQPDAKPEEPKGTTEPKPSSL